MRPVERMNMQEAPQKRQAMRWAHYLTKLEEFPTKPEPSVVH
jgi:hypothetical protein